MSKTYRPYSPDQVFLFPPSPRDWLASGHLAYFILDIITQLDLSTIHRFYDREERGSPPHHPQMMLGLLLYGYCTGVRSSRKIEKKTHEDVAFRIIAGGHHPDHSCICDFRNIHREAFEAIFTEVVHLCQKLGMVKLGHVSIDGTKLRANASKHKAMSYERMKKEEERERKLVQQILDEAEAIDRAEDEEERLNGGVSLPEELQRHESRMKKIREARKELEEEARAGKKAEKEERVQKKAEKRRREEEGPPELTRNGSHSAALPSHRIKAYKDGTPKPKSQRNFTDPESRIMKTKTEGFIQGYNCQVAVDAENQVIVSQAVTNQAPDPQHLPAVLEGIERNCGSYPDKLSGDSGYFSEENVNFCEDRCVDPYLSTARKKHGAPSPPKIRGRPPKKLSPRQKMQRRLHTKEGAAIYARRKVIVEPVFGQIKEARGLRRFLQRGLVKVTNEFNLDCIAHNLMKMFIRQGKADVVGQTG